MGDRERASERGVRIDACLSTELLRRCARCEPRRDESRYEARARVLLEKERGREVRLPASPPPPLRHPRESFFFFISCGEKRAAKIGGRRAEEQRITGVFCKECAGGLLFFWIFFRLLRGCSVEPVGNERCGRPK